MATCNVIIILSGAMKNDEFLSFKKYCESPFKKCVTINNKLSRNKFFYNPAVPQSVYIFKCVGYIISQIHVNRKIYVLFSTRTCTWIYALNSTI